MGRRHGDDRTRQNRTRSYPGGYERRGPPEDGLYGPNHDRRGNRYFEDRDGRRYYDDDFQDPHYRDYERESRQSTGRTAIKWASIVAVVLILVVGLVMATDDFRSGPDSAQQSPQQAPQQGVPQQPVQPQQPQAPQPAQPQAPSAPDAPGGASQQEVEGLRDGVDRQLAEIRQSIAELRAYIMGLFAGEQQEGDSA